MNLKLNIYGIAIEIEGPDAALGKTAKDFSYFRSADTDPDNGPEQVFLFSLRDKMPEGGVIPEGLHVSYCHPEFVQYDVGRTRYTDYNGAGLSVFETDRMHMTIYSDDTDFLHEICYLAILSVAGEKLEKKGLYRIHALSFSFRNTGAILLAPSGGGKTSLFLELLSDPGVKIFSDDIALTDRKANLYPFPLRIGVKEGNAAIDAADPGMVYEIKRRKYGRKILIDIAAFPGKISDPAKTRFILSARRWNSSGFRSRRTWRPAAGYELFKNLVVGYGLPQVLEYLNMRLRPKNVLAISGKIIFRSAVSLRLILSCRCYTVYLGRDQAANRRGLTELIQSGGKQG